MVSTLLYGYRRSKSRDCVALPAFPVSQLLDLFYERAIDVLGQNGDRAAVRLVTSDAGIRLDCGTHVLHCGLSVLA